MGKRPPPPDSSGPIEPVNLREALEERYLAYALSTIMHRALPDVRDGLKPVHRRVLYAMRQLRLEPQGEFRKCAKIVGDTMGNFHPHGNHGRVIARDGRLLAGSLGEDLSYEKFLVNIGGGQTWDATYTFSDAEGWTPNTNPVPVIERQLQNLMFKDDETWYSGSPYLGQTDDLPVGTTSHNQCGEYYHVWHSHALEEAANYDAAFGGMMTLERIDPPGGC